MVETLVRERPIPLREIASILPGAPRTRAGILNWVRRGVVGADGRTYKLRAYRVGHMWVTTRLALDEFIAATSAMPT